MQKFKETLWADPEKAVFRHTYRNAKAISKKRLILVPSINSQGFKRSSIYVEQTAQLYQNTYFKDLKTYIKDEFSSATDPFIFESVVWPLFKPRNEASRNFSEINDKVANNPVQSV